MGINCGGLQQRVERTPRELGDPRKHWKIQLLSFRARHGKESAWNSEPPNSSPPEDENVMSWPPGTGPKGAAWSFSRGICLPFTPISQVWLNTMIHGTRDPQEMVTLGDFSVPNSPYTCLIFKEKLNFESNEVGAPGRLSCLSVGLLLSPGS